MRFWPVVTRKTRAVWRMKKVGGGGKVDFFEGTERSQEWVEGVTLHSATFCQVLKSNTLVHCGQSRSLNINIHFRSNPSDVSRNVISQERIS